MTDPYQAGIVSENPFYKKQLVSGTIVAGLSLKYDRRGMKLMPQRSRAVLKNEIHELMLTDESATPGETADRIFCLGFFEVSSGGIIVRGDALLLGDRAIGTVIGFNDDHMPNHLNIIVHSPTPDTGGELCVDLEETVLIEKT